MEMNDLKRPANSRISAADVRDKMNEVSTAVREAATNSQATVIPAILGLATAGVWIAYRLGRRRGRSISRG